MRESRKSGSVGGDWLVVHDGPYSGTKAETLDTAKGRVYRRSASLYPDRTRSQRDPVRRGTKAETRETAKGRVYRRPASPCPGRNR